MAIRIVALFPLVALFTQCGSGNRLASNPGENPVGTGPFDRRGNYIEDWADSPDKWYRPSPVPTRPTAIAKNEKPSAPTLAANRAAPTPTPTVSNPQPRPQPAATPAPKPAPKPVVAKPKPKPPAKPAPIRYTVRAGDNLSRIAARHKSSVTAIQRANGITGSLIRPGQVLVIPRY